MTEPTKPQLDAACQTLALLVAPVRLHLLWLATVGEHDVGTLAKRAGVSITTASQHLAKLRLAGLITASREGRHLDVDEQSLFAMVAQLGEVTDAPAATTRKARRVRERRTATPVVSNPATEALERLETLLAWPAKPRMPNLLLVGPTNSRAS